MQGCKVVIEGLQKAPQYNGSTGEVRRYSEAKQRFVIELADSDSSILVRPQNLRLVKPG